MKNYQGFNAKNKTIISKVMSNFAMKFHAEEPSEPKPNDGGNQGDASNSTQADPTPTQTAPQVHFEDLIRKAREEEKAKLYPKITKLEKDKTDLVEKHNTALLTIGKLEQEVAKLTKDLESAKAEGGVVESEELAKVKKELADLKASAIDPEKIREEAKAEYEVKLYRMEKLNEVGKAVIPELVTGNTKEEIDASLESAVARYNEIVGNVQSTPQQKQPPVGNPSDGAFNINTINTDDIRNMTPAQWAEYRQKMNLK